MIEPRLQYNYFTTVDRRRRLGSDILSNNFILTWNHVLQQRLVTNEQTDMTTANTRVS